MRKRTADEWHTEVNGALRRYGRAEELEQHAACNWYQVRQLIAEGQASVVAIRRVLDDSFDTLDKVVPGGGSLLREQYKRGRSIEQIALDANFDASSLYRRRNRMVKELAVIIAEADRQAERAARAARFQARQPVVGFDRLIEDTAARLEDPAGPLVVILEGMGGLGKTTLAMGVAERLLQGERFTDVLWTSAKQVDFDVWSGRSRVTERGATDPDALVRDLARELRIDVVGDINAIRDEVRAHCKSAPYLIVFDNLETMADMDALAPLVSLLAEPSRVLITTRDRNASALPATLARSYIVLDELDAPTSLLLLREAARHTGASGLATAPDEELRRVYELTGGNPLALWLVAGQARGMPWQTFIQELIDYVPRGSRGYALYDYLYRRSWDQLGDDARLVLFAMHRAEHGAEHELLLALSELDREAFTGAVEELSSRMLLTFDGRIYHIHRLTYTFVRVVIAGWWD